MRQRIYLDTSVIGGYLDKEFQEWSRKLFDEFKTGKNIAVISDVTLDEIENARQEVRDLLKIIPEESKEYVLNEKEAEYLADAYLKEGAITKKFYEDALHIAIATINKVDVLVSWNFKHIVNLDRIKKYNGINLKHGYMILEIRNPREILKEK
ncbi:MAG: type II toxin-antitoxin system VapC family toxin [Chitinophagaceae bacterium]|nr:type II toxin-antitoxin system VapC family toxin [Chitinophagaceae bacterium]MDP1810169.1 type II toxin-antitoxin system VapC family toxin [Sediminibacterium sp.]MDP3127875.1 type II toxin-antitoxin system VapC family toxin [Sediminibacterium sp.]